jgi:hypothetical protein
MKIYALLRHIFTITVPIYLGMANMNVMNAFQNIDENHMNNNCHS